MKVVSLERESGILSGRRIVLMRKFFKGITTMAAAAVVAALIAAYLIIDRRQ